MLVFGRECRCIGRNKHGRFKCCSWISPRWFVLLRYLQIFGNRTCGLEHVLQLSTWKQLYTAKDGTRKCCTWIYASNLWLDPRTQVVLSRVYWRYITFTTRDFCHLLKLSIFLFVFVQKFEVRESQLSSCDGFHRPPWHHPPETKLGFVDPQLSVGNSAHLGVASVVFSHSENSREASTGFFRGKRNAIFFSLSWLEINLYS